MALFGSRRKGPRVLPYFGDPEALELRKELTGEEFHKTHSALASASALDREFLTSLLTEGYFGSLKALGRWVDAFPTSAVPLSFRGRHHIVLAWRARGDDVADSVSRRGWTKFFEHLESAESDLQRACELDPTDPTPWTGRLITARGLELGTEELLRRWEEVERRSPELLPAASLVLQGLAEKWGGSHAQMFDFARSRSEAAPDGSPMHALVAMAHIERWLYYDGFDDDEEGADAYLRDPAVRAELRAAAERSVASRAWVPHRWEIAERNAFAMALALVEDPAACDQFAVLGDRVTEEPWGYLDRPAAAFTRLRDEMCG
jgi:hypothetical protein